MPARTCPWCGTETLPYRDGHWRHVRACPKNPDPTCPKCGLHFVSYKIAGHVARCGIHKEQEAPASDSGLAQASPVAEAPASVPDAATQDVPPERRTPTDELVLPLIAAPTEKPAAPPAGKPKRGRPRRTMPPATNPAAAPASPAAPPERGLVATFEDGRDVPRIAAFAGFGDSLKRNWVLLLVIALGLVLVLVWRRMNAAEHVPIKAPAQLAPPLPASRPPYNPELHGSLENYRAAYAHLSPNGGA